jgi:hypothetical protein
LLNFQSCDFPITGIPSLSLLPRTRNGIFLLASFSSVLFCVFWVPFLNRLLLPTQHYTTGLTTPLAGVPEGKLTTQLPTEVESKVLANGITIVAYKNPQPLNTISLFIRAGSRFETAKTAGASHFLKRFAFKVPNALCLFGD